MININYMAHGQIRRQYYNLHFYFLNKYIEINNKNIGLINNGFAFHLIYNTLFTNNERVNYEFEIYKELEAKILK